MVGGLDRFKTHFAGYTDQYVLIDPEFDAVIPVKVRDDLKIFVERIANEEIDLKSFGIANQSLSEVLMELRRVYGID